MNKYLAVFLIFVISCRSEQSEEFNRSLTSLLKNHLSDTTAVNLVVQPANLSKAMLQFTKHEEEVELQIVGHAEVNNLKQHFTALELMLTKHKLQHYYGSTKNILYCEFTSDEVDKVVKFSHDFFRADFLNANLEELVFSITRKGVDYSDYKNLLQHDIVHVRTEH